MSQELDVTLDMLSNDLLDAAYSSEMDNKKTMIMVARMLKVLARDIRVEHSIAMQESMQS
jgi:hypothetical protein